MDKKKIHIFLLLIVFSTIIAEKAIPHSHIEIEGKVLPDWHNSEEVPQSDHDSETLHSSFFHPPSFDFSFEQKKTIQTVFVDFTQKYIEGSFTIPDYNILPKVHNSILFIVHTYSSKAPPLYCLALNCVH